MRYPGRWDGPAARLDFQQAFALEFFPPDEERFPALGLGHEIARRGGTAGAVLNAANEAAVTGFLRGQIRFMDVVPACRAVLDEHNYDPSPTLQQLWELDAWARKEMTKWMGV